MYTVPPKKTRKSDAAKQKIYQTAYKDGKMGRSVCVMMSSYNGEQFITKQIETILSQKNVDITLLIRDDGSTDNTKNIIKQYIEKHKIILIEGGNIGWMRSFLNLIENADKYGSFDFYALADQDDIWHDDKLISAVMQIEEIPDSAVLYGSNLRLIDSEGNYIGMLYKNIDNAKNGLKNRYFLGSSPFGCSMVWNKKLQNVFLKNPPKEKFAHDIWMHLLARSIGSVIIDEYPHIDHVIHGRNAAGIEKNQLKRIIKFFRIYMRRDYPKMSSLLKFFSAAYGEENIENEHKDIIMLVLNYDRSLRDKIALLNCEYFRSFTFKVRMRYRFFVLINKL